MATYQSAFNETFAVGVIGQVANTEPYNSISRTNPAVLNFGIPVYEGAANHQVIAGTTFAATGTGSAAAGNVGTSTITAAPAITAAKKGRYTIVQLATSATGALLVTDPDGVVVGHGVVGTAITTVPGITSFTVTSGGTATIGDTFYIDVVYDANSDFVGISIRDPSVPALASAPDQYPANYTCSIMDFGVMWVRGSGTCVRGGAAYWNPATGFWTPSTGILVPGCEFYEDAVSTLVRVKLRRIAG